jgi:hypothetical protein
MYPCCNIGKTTKHGDMFGQIFVQFSIRKIYMNDKKPYNKIEYNTKYNKDNYTDLKIRIQKGTKETIENHWKSNGYKSLNAYIITLIKKDMES